MEKLQTRATNTNRYEHQYSELASVLSGRQCANTQNIIEAATSVIALFLEATDKNPENMFDVNKVRHGISGSFVITLMQENPRMLSLIELLIRERYSPKSSISDIITQLGISALAMPYLTLWSYGRRILSFFTSLRKYIRGIDIKHSEHEDWNFLFKFLIAMLHALEIAWWTSEEIMKIEVSNEGSSTSWNKGNKAEFISSIKDLLKERSEPCCFPTWAEIKVCMCDIQICILHCYNQAMAVNSDKFFNDYTRLGADSLVPISRTYDFLLMTTTSHSLLKNLFADIECKLYEMDKDVNLDKTIDNAVNLLFVLSSIMNRSAQFTLFLLNKKFFTRAIKLCIAEELHPSVKIRSAFIYGFLPFILRDINNINKKHKELLKNWMNLMNYEKDPAVVFSTIKQSLPAIIKELELNRIVQSVEVVSLDEIYIDSKTVVGCCYRGCKNMQARAERLLTVYQCDDCRTAWYCSRFCQMSAYESHKKTCHRVATNFFKFNFNE